MKQSWNRPDWSSSRSARCLRTALVLVPVACGTDPAAPASELSVTPEVLLLAVGEHAALSIVSADQTRSSELQWTSTDSGVVSVDDAGGVTGVRAGRAAVVVTAPWGADTATVAVGPVAFESLSAGEAQTCGIITHGLPFCWGSAWWGELGNGVAGAHEESRVPVPVSIHVPLAQLSAGSGVTCGLDTGGALYCWGANVHGQLGNGRLRQRHVAVPTPIAPGLRFSQIEAGSGHSCALTTSGSLYCWGSNATGAVGTGEGTLGDHFPAPVEISTPVPLQSITVGGLSCGLAADGRAYCWSNNRFGQVGDGTATPRLAPAPAADTLRFSEIGAGGIHVCGLTPEGQVYCWGNNWYGQLGLPSDSVEASLTPVLQDLGQQVIDLSVGGHHTCVRVRDGSTLCWGDDRHGQLGDGEPFGLHSSTPVRVSSRERFESIVPGQGTHACALTPAGAAYCWGNNLAGQLGIGSDERLRTEPAPVLAPGES